MDQPLPINKMHLPDLAIHPPTGDKMNPTPPVEGLAAAFIHRLYEEIEKKFEGNPAHGDSGFLRADRTSSYIAGGRAETASSRATYSGSQDNIGRSSRFFHVSGSNCGASTENTMETIKIPLKKNWKNFPFRRMEPHSVEYVCHGGGFVRLVEPPTHDHHLDMSNKNNCATCSRSMSDYFRGVTGDKFAVSGDQDEDMTKPRKNLHPRGKNVQTKSSTKMSSKKQGRSGKGRKWIFFRTFCGQADVDE